MRDQVRAWNLRKRKRESGGGINDSPGRKRQYRPRSRPKMNGKAVFLLVNLLIHLALPVEALALLLGVDVATVSAYAVAGCWLWFTFVKSRFPTPSARCTKNRAPQWHAKHFNRRIQKIIDCFPIYVENSSGRKIHCALYNK